MFYKNVSTMARLHREVKWIEFSEKPMKFENKAKATIHWTDGSSWRVFTLNGLTWYTDNGSHTPMWYDDYKGLRETHHAYDLIQSGFIPKIAKPPEDDLLLLEEEV